MCVKLVWFIGELVIKFCKNSWCLLECLKIKLRNEMNCVCVRWVEYDDKYFLKLSKVCWYC